MPRRNPDNYPRHFVAVRKHTKEVVDWLSDKLDKHRCDVVGDAIDHYVDCPECGSKLKNGKCINPTKHGGDV